LVGTLAKMYVQGVSTRKVKAVTETLCGHSFSASSISAINKRLRDTCSSMVIARASRGFTFESQMAGRKNRGLPIGRSNGEGRAAFDVIALGEDRDAARHDQPTSGRLLLRHATAPCCRSMIASIRSFVFEDIDDVPEAIPKLSPARKAGLAKFERTSQTEPSTVLMSMMPSAG
jgi:hypothetical protein